MTAPEYEMPKDVVPPGDQTGIYYIPISNLPFNVSWQQIKDYVRQVCDVDHVEIFQISTSGWIRVKGRENFDMAFAHLNGKEFNGRAIIADGRNGESPILVRDLEVCKPTGSNNRSSSRAGGSTATTTSAAPDTPLYATAGSVSYTDSSMFSSPKSTTSSGFSQVGPKSHTTSSSYSSSPGRDPRPREYQCLISMPAARELMPQRFAQGGAPDGYGMPLSSSSFIASPNTSFSPGLAAGYDHLPTGFSPPGPYGFGLPVQQSFMSPYAPSSDGPQAMYNASTAYAVQPPNYSDYYPPNTSSLTAQMSNMAIGHSGGGGVIYTEQRGVHIRDISRRASEDQIRKMIRDATGPEASLIEMIKVPVQDGSPRGHAFIHLRSANLAKRMVDHLDGYEFKGRRLQVRLMKEGEAISSGMVASTSLPSPSSSTSSSKLQRSSGGKHHRHRKEDGRRTEHKERDSSRPQKSASRTASTTILSSSGSKSTPLVVGGSLAPASSSSASLKEKHGKKSSVVIADGSSGRRPSDSDKKKTVRVLASDCIR